MHVRGSKKCVCGGCCQTGDVSEMQHDALIWEIISHGQCSFRSKCAPPCVNVCNIYLCSGGGVGPDSVSLRPLPCPERFVWTHALTRRRSLRAGSARRRPSAATLTTSQDSVIAPLAPSPTAVTRRSGRRMVGVAAVVCVFPH